MLLISMGTNLRGRWTGTKIMIHVYSAINTMKGSLVNGGDYITYCDHSDRDVRTAIVFCLLYLFLCF